MWSGACVHDGLMLSLTNCDRFAGIVVTFEGRREFQSVHDGFAAACGTGRGPRADVGRGGGGGGGFTYAFA